MQFILGKYETSTIIFLKNVTYLLALHIQVIWIQFLHISSIYLLVVIYINK